MERYEDQKSDRRDNDRNQNQGWNDNDSSRPQSREDNNMNTQGQNPQRGNQGDTDDLERNWRDMESSYRQRYPNLTDEDVHYRSGEFDTMTERVASRTNRTRRDIENDIRNWKGDRDRQ